MIMLRWSGMIWQWMIKHNGVHCDQLLVLELKQLTTDKHSSRSCSNIKQWIIHMTGIINIGRIEVSILHIFEVSGFLSFENISVIYNLSDDQKPILCRSYLNSYRHWWLFVLHCVFQLQYQSIIADCVQFIYYLNESNIVNLIDFVIYFCLKYYTVCNKLIAESMFDFQTLH